MGIIRKVQRPYPHVKRGFFLWSYFRYIHTVCVSN